MIDERPIDQIKNENYDVVIVGGGVVGSIVARVLTESAWRDRKVISILMLEAGPASPFSDAGYQAHVDTYREASIKTPNSPYPSTLGAPDPGQADYFLQEGPLRFDSTNTRTLGGTTLHWLGISLRMMPNDFSMNDTFGRGVNWPINYFDLQKDYEKAEWELGVSADVDDQVRIHGIGDDYFRSGYEYPMEAIPTTYLDSVFRERIGNDFTHELGGKPYPVELIPIPQARNSRPRIGVTDPRSYLDDLRLSNNQLDGTYQPVGSPEEPVTGVGQRCQGNSSCIPICPARAKYTALKTLGAVTSLAQHQSIRVDVLSRAVVSEVVTDNQNRVTQLVVKKYSDDLVAHAQTIRVSGRFVVLAGSAIENAKILLNSRTRQGNIVANESDQLGRNLMDHPFVQTWGKSSVPVWPFRGPAVTSDLPMREGAFRNEHAAFRTDVYNWGWNLTTFSPQSDLVGLLPKPDRRSKTYHDYETLRARLKDSLQSQIVMGYLIEQLPDANNRVTLREDWLDDLGVPKPVLHYDIDEYSRAGFRAAFGLTRSVFKKIGAEDRTKPMIIGQEFDYKGEDYSFIGAGHIMGTHRMGCSSRESVVNSYQQSWEHDNLYITGCGSMPTGGTSNPTLTASALAIRSGEHLYQNLELRQR